ncbi:MAG: 16S rRNA (uracil(1498)-N(3))-methyltransferase [Azoarcus sp.]|jgi:16S rRNA (uracil1498-N3)-methyltransferase|nr:16S rRNA (uracil(1498)-N(3))-methyltransferase [Azoarcus sp.]
MSPRFYFPGILPRVGEIAFPPAAAHHALKVLRLASGDAVTLFDGSGGELRARLDIRARSAYAVDGQWLETDGRESPLALVLVQALISAGKMDWAIQKAVELGASGFIPLLSARSLPHPGDGRAARKSEHWRQTIIAACEQCGRNRLPFIAPVQNLAAYLGRRQDAMRLLFLPGGPRLSTIRPLPSIPVHLLIGPEGGWSEEEQMLCQRAGCQPVGLGPRILRTETAGLAAIAALQALAGDF